MLPVYLVPGTMCNAKLWGSLVEYLNCPHRYSHVEIESCITVAQMRSLLKSKVQNDCHLITFSMGSYLAISSIIDAMHTVKSLVIIGSDLRALSEEEVQIRQSLLQWLKTNRYTGMSRRRAEKFVSHQNEDYQAVLDTLLLMDQELGEEVLKVQLCETTLRRSLVEYLSGINIPVLIIAGKEDNFIDVDSLSLLVHQKEYSDLSLIDNCGHMVPLEKPEELGALINKFYKDNKFV